MFILPAAVHKLAQFGFVAIRNRKPVGGVCNLCVRSEATTLSVLAEWDRSRQKEKFPNYAPALMHKYIISISLPSSNCFSEITLFHLSPHTDARSLLSDLRAQPTLPLPHPHYYSRLLLPAPSVSLAVYFHIDSQSCVLDPPPPPRARALFANGVGVLYAHGDPD